MKNKTIHKASEEQYDRKEHVMNAQDIWHDFCAAHWPEAVRAEESSQAAAAASATPSATPDNDFDDLLQESDWVMDTVDSSAARRVSAAI